MRTVAANRNGRSWRGSDTMHHALIPVIELALAGAAWAWSRTKNSTATRPADWTGSRTLDLPLREVRGAVALHLAGRGCVVFECEDTFDVYRRGDRSVTRVPWERDLRWIEIPMLVGTIFIDVNGKTSLDYRVWAWPTVTYSSAGKEFFLRQAQAEFDGILAVLDRLKAEREGSGRAGSSGRHRWYTDEDEPQSRRDATASSASLDADLALLGLDRGATLEQVKKAYRVASFKYHPDRLTGKNVEPHLVELAVQRFKEVTAAHQRLCEHFAQPQRA